MILEEIHIRQRLCALKLKAAQRYNICPEKCHVGHLVLEGFLGNPTLLNQIDAATETSETNESVAIRSMRLASALSNYGLKPGDPVVVIGPNHLDMAIPYYACHFNGYPMCGMDPTIGPVDLQGLLPYVCPKAIFCFKNAAEYVKQAFAATNLDAKIIVFDDENNNMEKFIQENNGTEVNFRPAEFNHSEIAAWLVLTSGTTGLPKVAVIPYDTLLNSICCWWEKFTGPVKMVLTMSTFQWMSSLLFFICGPMRQYTRLQCSAPLTPPLLIGAINKYRPHVTAWTPHLLGQFLQGTEKICDLSCFKYIIIAGSPMEKPILDRVRARCDAFLYLVYSMTELLVPAFDFGEDTPFGSVGLPFEKYKYMIVDDEGHELGKPFKSGELWIKGDAFFKEYLKNPEETREMVTEDGWFKTGDIFYKDNENYYYFVERKRLLIKSAGYWISPLQLEDIVKRHPAVAYSCVVGIPDRERMEVPVAAIVRKNGSQINPKEIFDLVKESMPDLRQLHGGFFYMDQLPITSSGKVHRAKVKEVALTAKRILPTSS
ncbi:luciferin 4-monooxygenase-like [Ostrinia furnacalis]|uniref:luciferin 4-monooxygenase-like n=1 Tax=Ostrinia furnacalis TaxID=93504 RepID=UPI00103DDC26|nr:luciferin 4-monooxygenase-like [Ostrinia furnacalis]